MPARSRRDLVIGATIAATASIGIIVGCVLVFVHSMQVHKYLGAVGAAILMLLGLRFGQTTYLIVRRIWRER